MDCRLWVFLVIGLVCILAFSFLNDKLPLYRARTVRLPSILTAACARSLLASWT